MCKSHAELGERVSEFMHCAILLAHLEVRTWRWVRHKIAHGSFVECWENRGAVLSHLTMPVNFIIVVQTFLQHHLLWGQEFQKN